MPNDEEKRSRHRSPNYPAIGLQEAIERVRQLYEADKRAGAPVDVALRHMGFSSRHGKALAVLSALRKYGLVEDSAGRVLPTQRAITILAYPEEDKRRVEALREAALGPDVFRTLYERYAAGDYLPSDPTLKAELEAEMGFNPNAIGDFIKDFKNTLAYARLLDPDTLRLSWEPEMPTAIDNSASRETKPREFVSVNEANSGTPRGLAPLTQQPVQEIGWNQDSLQFKISEEAEAKIYFRGRVTAEAIDKLRAILEISRDTYPSAKLKRENNTESGA